ncbi:MAG: hypothetical protein U5L72_05250 [Bacteroidales bacterium]|nr:hypothetical protein [Bacteroidales bacterium]
MYSAIQLSPTPSPDVTREVADIFYNVSEEAAFELLFSQPDNYTSLADPGELIPVLASASVCDSLVLLQNNVRLKKVTETTLSHSVTAPGSGLFKLLVRAWITMS